jgi:hypothetical protein
MDGHWQLLVAFCFMRRVHSTNRRHKKARRACAVQAFRTLYQVLVTINKEFWWTWTSNANY